MRHYYTYKDLMELLSCSKSTLEKKLPTMNIKKVYFGNSRPYFLIVDVHAYMLFNQSFKQCNQRQKAELRELLIYE